MYFYKMISASLYHYNVEDEQNIRLAAIGGPCARLSARSQAEVSVAAGDWVDRRNGVRLTQKPISIANSVLIHPGQVI
jgi:hypothetical protein